MIAFLASLLKPIMASLATWLAEKHAGRQTAKIEGLQNYVEISKRINSVDAMSDPDAAGEWLRNRSKQRSNL